MLGCAVAALLGSAGSARALGVSVGTPPSQMTLLHSTPATSTSAITITNAPALLGTWTVTIRDASATTPGRMDRVNCSTRALLGGSLQNALQWSSSWSTTLGGSGSASGTVSGSNQTLASGSTVLVALGTINVTYTQSLGGTEGVAAGACYEITVTLTAT